MNRRTVSIIKVPTKTLPPHSLFRYSSGTVPDEEALQNVLQAAIAEAEADGWQFVELTTIAGALMRDQGDCSFAMNSTCALAITWEQMATPSSGTAQPDTDT